MNRLLTVSIVAAALSAGLAVAAEYPRPPQDETTGKFMYREVVEAKGLDGSDLYSRAKAWVATAYRSANDVIQLDDPAAGRLIAKGNFGVTYYMGEAWIRHTLSIEVKDGRFRVTLTDFHFDNGHWDAPLEDEKKFTGQRKKLFAQVIEKSEQTLADLKAEMTKQPEKDDW